MMSTAFDVAEIFGMNVFSDALMKKHLPKKVYQDLQRTIQEDAELSAATAEVVANAMSTFFLFIWATVSGNKSYYLSCVHLSHFR